MRSCWRSCNEPFAADVLVAGVLDRRAGNFLQYVCRDRSRCSSAREIVFGVDQRPFGPATPAFTGGFIPAVAGDDPGGTGRLFDQSPVANPRTHSCEDR